MVNDLVLAGKYLLMFFCSDVVKKKNHLSTVHFLEEPVKIRAPSLMLINYASNGELSKGFPSYLSFF